MCFVCWFELTKIHVGRKHSGKKDVSIHELPLEMGFIDKLIEMFNIRKILRNLKRQMEKSDGLSTGYGQKKFKRYIDDGFGITKG